MRVAFIMGFFPALSTTFIQNQLTSLIDAGHEVHVFAFRRPDEQKIHPIIAEYHLLERTSYFNIPANRFARILKAVFLGIRNFHRAPRLLLKTLNIPKYGMNALNLNLFYFALPFIGKRFDILHAHFGPNGVVGWWLKELGIEGKLITTFYGADLSSTVRENGVAYYQPLFSRADLLLPICRYFQEKLIGWGCEKERVRVHPVGIDTTKYKPSGLPKGPGKRFRILTVARLVEKKGIEYGLRAVAEASRKHGQIDYTIAGFGPDAGRLRELAEELGITQRVSFVGAVTQDEEVRLLQQHDLFLLPSVTAADGEEEGTPTVLLEAQASGLPVVATRHSGIPEIVREGETGFLVAERDTDALAERIACLIQNPTISEAMGRRGRVYIEKSFDIRMLNARLAGIYEDLLRGKPARSAGESVSGPAPDRMAGSPASDHLSPGNS